MKFLKVILSDRQLTIGTCMLLLLLFVAFAGPYLAPYDPYYYGSDVLALPGDLGHLLGTNNLGQDVWSMVIYGVRTSLKVALGSAFISAVIGVMVGGVAGYFGGKVDAALSEVINVFMMIPSFFLILLIVALFGSNITNVMLCIGLTTWPSNARLMRAQALSLRERTFVRSATAMGESRLQVLLKYIIPNGIFPVIANTTLGMSGAILTEAGLSFLGLGDPNIISWGQMIYAGKSYITTAWWISGFAGVAIIVAVLTFYLLGDGLNHVLDPKRKRRA
jgi:peptide/nickel transport system permease protein